MGKRFNKRKFGKLLVKFCCSKTATVAYMLINLEETMNLFLTLMRTDELKLVKGVHDLYD